MLNPYRFTFILLLVVSSCGDGTKKEDKFFIVKGKTMGSTYEIAYDSSINLKEKIEYTLGYYNYLLSTYDSNSIISKFNENRLLSIDDSISFEKSRYIFEELDSISRKVYSVSKGTFNPALSSLINYWGFGENRKNPDQADQRKIDSLKALNFGFKIDFKNRKPLKADPRMKLNFNAIAPGQAADVIARLFDSVYRFKNYYINVGGEIRTKGNNGTDSYWPIKIEKPMFNSLKPIEFCKVPLKNYSLATSGNYRQFYFYKGKRFSHSIDPRSGFPARNEIMSATVLAPSTAEADAYATSCMVLGLEESIKMIKSDSRLKAFIIFEKDGKLEFWASENLSYQLSKEN